MFRRIIIFLAVARHLSYTKAAEELYISQPAVSKQIKELEHEWHVRLFERHGNKIVLTTAGKTAYKRCKSIIRSVENVEFELGAFSDTVAGRLRIGASTTIAQYIIPRLMAAFAEKYPSVSLSLLAGNTAAINSLLRDDQIDLAITEGSKKINAFSYHPFIDDEIALVSHQQSPLTLSPTISADKLPNIPLAIREIGSGTREVFQRAVTEMGFPMATLTVAISLGSTESIKSYVQHAPVAGVFSSAALSIEGGESLFKVTRITDHPISRTFTFAISQGQTHKLSEQFIYFCEETDSKT